ncbi:MAG: OmpA family protein [Pirellulales bacterium]
MRRALWSGWVLIAAGAAVCAGCNTNPFAPAGQATAWQQPGQQQPYEAQLAELNRRTGQLDANNRDLHAQLAQSAQQVQVMKDQIGLLQKQLQDSAQQLRESQVARQDAEQKLETLQASYQRRGGAVITANSSIRQTLTPVEVPGVAVRQDGDVIRLEIPSDQLFVGGGTQLQPTAYLLLDQVATAILRSYPRQRIGVEAHTDSVGPTGIASSAHQLTTVQATAVLDQLVQRNKIPPQQLFVVAHGANHPRASSVTAEGRLKNRRLEVVIYPESIDGR